MSGFIQLSCGALVVGHPLKAEHDFSTLRTATFDPLRGAVEVWRPILQGRQWFDGRSQPVQQVGEGV